MIKAETNSMVEIGDTLWLIVQPYDQIRVHAVKTTVTELVSYNDKEYNLVCARTDDPKHTYKFTYPKYQLQPTIPKHWRLEIDFNIPAMRTIKPRTPKPTEESDGNMLPKHPRNPRLARAA